MPAPFDDPERAIAVGDPHVDGRFVASEVLLPVRGPFDSPGLFAWMAARSVAGAEVAATDAYARTLLLPGGSAWFRVTHPAATPDRIRLETRLSQLSDLPVLVTRVRRLFDLDAAPRVIDHALGVVPELTAAVAGTPGIRVPGSIDPHEMLIRAMIGQQISVAAARTALSRLTDELGERIAPHQGTDRLLPTMAAIAEHGAEVLRGPAARIRAITGAARALADGSLTLSTADDPVAQRAALVAMPGIGPWTADYVRMRVTGDPDVLLPGDVAARAGAAHLGIPSDPAGLVAWSTRAAPWRSYLTAHLWRAVPR
jgi:AraC family transcriptional regulator of adaptative response / DNA-3-methyladenine glycosylase II